MNVFFRVVSTVFWIVYGTFFVLGVVVGSSTLQSNLLPFKSFIVQSGSMEPTIMTGDVVLVQPQTNYNLNEIITYTNAENRTVTHRIISSKSADKKLSFETKGDNNRTKDPEFIPTEKIIGGYWKRLPQVGRILLFGQTPIGMTAVIALPIIFIVGSELFKDKPMKNEQK